MAALLSALDDHKDPRTALALRLMLACGLRRGEALGLQWQDLDLEAGTLTVTRAWARGGGSGRVTLPKTAMSARTVPIPHATLER
ncbi:tyrosine-type recombinase/integrase, partial [Acinetobacter baumannii]